MKSFVLCVLFILVSVSCYGAATTAVSSDNTCIIITGTEADGAGYDVMAQAAVVAAGLTYARIKNICWSGTITVAHSVEFHDAGGNLFCPKFTSVNANEGLCTPELNRVVKSGALILDLMESGTITIQLRGRLP